MPPPSTEKGKRCHTAGTIVQALWPSASPPCGSCITIDLDLHNYIWPVDSNRAAIGRGNRATYWGSQPGSLIGNPNRATGQKSSIWANGQNTSSCAGSQSGVLIHSAGATQDSGGTPQGIRQATGQPGNRATGQTADKAPPRSQTASGSFAPQPGNRASQATGQPDCSPQPGSLITPRNRAA